MFPVYCIPELTNHILSHLFFSFTNTFHYTKNNYFIPWCRFSPYVWGILLGYALHVTKGKPFKMSKVKIDHPRTTAKKMMSQKCYTLFFLVSHLRLSQQKDDTVVGWLNHFCHNTLPATAYWLNTNVNTFQFQNTRGGLSPSMVVQSPPPCRVDTYLGMCTNLSRT